MKAELLREGAVREEVVAYYEAKTETILRRYGPGPRVHYHTGLEDAPPHPGLAAEELRRRIHASQERLLSEMARAVGAWRDGWDVLDVGCGLGGGTLYWATEHAARVTAITVVPSHVAWVKRFAAEAGVASRVTAQVCDALEVPGHACFDAVVAVESSCYLPRREWLRKVRALLRPRGVVVIADCFLGRPEVSVPFDRYWRTRIGTVTEYLRAASEVGLELDSHSDLSRHTVNFWTLTLDLLSRERERLALSRGTGGRSESQREHLRLQQGMLDGSLLYGLMVLRRQD